MEPLPVTPPSRGIPRCASGRLYGSALAVTLALGLVLRVANLGAVQHFQGDQGRDYLEVMGWLRDGRWPLLGPLRITGDYTLGPGWYYTLAPGLGLSGFHPAAGAAVMAVFGVLAAALAGEWVRRATRDRLAALAVATVYAFSAPWVFEGRTLWNPHPMSFGVVAVAWLIQRLRRSPASSAPALAALLALLPALAAWRIRQRNLRKKRSWKGPAKDGRKIAARFRKWRSGAAWVFAGLFIAALYVPPLLYELQPGHPSNLGGYFSRTVFPGLPAAGSWGERAQSAYNRLALASFSHVFESPLFLSSPAHRTTLLLFLRALTLALAVELARRAWRRRLEPSVLFAVLLIGGYGLLAVLKGGRRT